MITDKIYLVGFMAAGKTTLAKALARRLDWQALDIDELIEKRERLAVAEIFARRGEPYFRAAERDVLYELLRDGKITDESRRRLERDLDLEEATILARREGETPL